MSRTVDTRWQAATFVALAALTTGLTAALVPSSSDHFQRFLGGASPVLVAIAASVVGGAALALLGQQFGFHVLRGRTTLRGIATSAGLASVLGVAIVLADLLIRYPEDMNVPMPQALLFYPAMGFVAEMVFHVLPLALLLLASIPLRARVGAERLVWIAIGLVAMSEPTFQVSFGGEPLTWGAVYTWIHVFAIAGLQLYVFRRYDFVSMYAMRLFYYVYWHILWGVIRLEILF